MKNKGLIISVCLLTLYLLMLSLTEYSLTGFWSDIIFIWICASIITWQMLPLIKLKKVMVKGLIILGLTLSVVITLLNVNTFLLDHLKLTSFPFHKIEGRFFHSYFKPVGSYSDGEGNFWISESPILFPLIEIQIYYKHAVTWDFRSSEFDGKLIDQRDVSEAWIIREVFEKKSLKKTKKNINLVYQTVTMFFVRPCVELPV